MDVQHFDAITKAWGSMPRRRLLRGLAGSALGVLPVTLGAAQTGATHFGCLDVGQHCKDQSQCCSGRCKRHRCRAHNVGRCTAAKDFCLTGKATCGGGSCFCYPTTGGANFCSQGSGICMACSKDAQCAVALNSPSAACVESNHGSCSCSGGFATFCALPCTA